MPMKKLCLVVTLIFSPLTYSDVMNLNEFVPTHLEDASPVDEHSTIFQLSCQFEKEDKDDVTWRPDIRYGLTKRIQLEVLTDIISGGDENQSGETKAGVLYQVNESSNAFPVLSLNPVAQIPTGKHSRGTDLGMKFLLTSTISGTQKKPEAQLHLNYEYLNNASRRPRERAGEFLFAFGYSRRIRQNMALVIDYYHEADTPQDRDEDFFEAGIHQQAGEKLYFSLGAGVDVGSAKPHWTVISAVEYEI